MAGVASLPAGKLPPDLLHRCLQGLPTADPDLIVGPGTGEDAAVINISRATSLCLAAKSDPITFATEEIGYYALHVCANDLAVTGAVPRFYLPTILLPAGRAPESLVQEIFVQIGDACRDLGVTVAGGHTEITDAVRRPVIAGSLLGTVPRDQVVTSNGARPGDLLLVAGVLPVEAVSIMARERRAVLLQRGWSETELDRAARYLHDPGISIVQPALLAAARRLATAMHDPTEGGVATAAAELVHASGTGIQLDLDALPIPALAWRLCREFGINPWGAIASGCLLCTVAPAHASTLARAWETLGWPVTHIGEIVPAAQGLCARSGTRRRPWPHFETDEITRLFA